MTPEPSTIVAIKGGGGDGGTAPPPTLRLSSVAELHQNTSHSPKEGRGAA